MVWADGTPYRDILCADESDDGRADGGGDVHGTAVVAEKEIELRGEGGELSDGQRAVEDDEVGLGGRADGVEQRTLGGTAH